MYVGLHKKTIEKGNYGLCGSLNELYDVLDALYALVRDVQIVYE